MRQMRIKPEWLKYLWKSRKNRIPQQFIRMANFHRTAFEILLGNIFDAAEQYDAGFTFPIVASAAQRNPGLVRMILDSHHEIAAHGFKHVNYRYLSKIDQEIDIERSTTAFKSMNIPIYGFRAPYNAYTDHTPELIEGRFVWDAGIGYDQRYSEERSFFRIRVADHESSFVCSPLSGWSDDAMIDRYGMDNRQMTRILGKTIKQTADEHGVIMFDLHPIRIGQPEYIDVLRQTLDYGRKLNGWFPTVTEAVNYWNKHKEWKDGASFCCLLTGDIDNFAFTDYLLRLL